MPLVRAWEGCIRKGKSIAVKAAGKWYGHISKAGSAFGCMPIVACYRNPAWWENYFILLYSIMVGKGIFADI
jgi:hypothetical protein